MPVLKNLGCKRDKYIVIVNNKRNIALYFLVLTKLQVLMFLALGLEEDQTWEQVLQMSKIPNYIKTLTQTIDVN